MKAPDGQVVWLFSSQTSADSPFSCYLLEVPLFLQKGVFILDVPPTQYISYPVCIPIDCIQIYMMNDERRTEETVLGGISSIMFIQRWKCKLWGTEAGGWSSNLYNYITAAAMYRQDPSTVSNPGTQQALFNGANPCCWALDPCLCSVPPLCTSRCFSLFMLSFANFMP